MGWGICVSCLHFLQSPYWLAHTSGFHHLYPDLSALFEFISALLFYMAAVVLLFVATAFISPCTEHYPAPIVLDLILFLFRLFVPVSFPSCSDFRSSLISILTESLLLYHYHLSFQFLCIYNFATLGHC